MTLLKEESRTSDVIWRRYDVVIPLVWGNQKKKKKKKKTGGLCLLPRLNHRGLPIVSYCCFNYFLAAVQVDNNLFRFIPEDVCTLLTLIKKMAL